MLQSCDVQRPHLPAVKPRSYIVTPLMGAGDLFVLMFSMVKYSLTVHNDM